MVSSMVTMPTKFDLYLVPCAANIDLELSRIYSPYRKPIWAIDDVIQPRLANDKGSSGDGHDHDVFSPLSSQNMASSFGENSNQSSQYSTKTREKNPQWFHPLFAHETASGPCRDRPRDNSKNIERELPSRRAVLHRGTSLPGPMTSHNTCNNNGTLPRRRHFSFGVKFADEVGENLAMFSIIPSHFEDHHYHQFHPRDRQQPSTVQPQLLQDARTCSALPTDTSVTLSDDDLPPPWIVPPVSTSSSDPQTFVSTTGTFYLRMFFNQPIADLTTFQRRLDEQSVCLENVMAIVTTPNISNIARRITSSLSVLCTAKVKHTTVMASSSFDDALVGVSSRKLFARWTNNEWQSYADISAHCVNCPSRTVNDRDVTSPTVTANWIAHTQCVDTYSFAVQLQTCTSSSVLDERQLPTSRAVSKSCAEVGGSSSGLLEHRHHTEAVEFALFYTTDGSVTLWDNNNGKNYRIMWCYDKACQ